MYPEVAKKCDLELSDNGSHARKEVVCRSNGFYSSDLVRLVEIEFEIDRVVKQSRMRSGRSWRVFKDRGRPGNRKSDKNHEDDRITTTGGRFCATCKALLQSRIQCTHIPRRCEK